jgi:hypothetical protein
MLGDAVSAKRSSGEAAESLEVVDVAQILVRSVRPPAAATTADPVSSDADPPGPGESG